MDRQFIHEQGLPDRPSFRHLIFAPSSTNTYAGSAFPGIGDEMKRAQGDPKATQKQIGLITAKLEAVTRSISDEVSFNQIVIEPKILDLFTYLGYNFLGDSPRIMSLVICLMKKVGYSETFNIVFERFWYYYLDILGIETLEDNKVIIVRMVTIIF